MVVALAAIAADADDLAAIREGMVAVTTGGTPCATFADCKQMLLEGGDIDYDGYSGVDWNEHGEPAEASIGVFEYGDENLPIRTDVVTGRL